VLLAGSSVATLIALLVGLDPRSVERVTMAVLVALAMVGLWDYAASRAAWQRASPQMVRRLPAAFAIGAR